MVTVRIWLIHSVWSEAPGDCQVARPFSSSRPTVFSQSRRPVNAFASSSVRTFESPVCAAAFRTAALIVGSATSLAQSASLDQKPQPPVDWREYPLSL